MEKIPKYFKHDYENDTTIEYVNTGLYSMLNCSYTSEDEDYGTDTIHYTVKPAVSMSEIANKMCRELSEFCNKMDAGLYNEVSGEARMKFGDYSNSTLYAIENALMKIKEEYYPTKRYATIRDASEWIAKELIADRTKKFDFCESNYEEAKGDPNDHEEQGGWHGIERIDGFFNNEPEEFIVAVGYYGGGHVAFGYNDIDSKDDVNEYAQTIRRTICQATGWDSDSMIYIEEEEK